MVKSIFSYALWVRDTLLQNCENYLIHSVINARRNHLYHVAITGNKQDQNINIHFSERCLTLNQIEQLIGKNNIITGTGIERLNATLLRDNQCLIVPIEKNRMSWSFIISFT